MREWVGKVDLNPSSVDSKGPPPALGHLPEAVPGISVTLLSGPLPSSRAAVVSQGLDLAANQSTFAHTLTEPSPLSELALSKGTRPLPLGGCPGGGVFCLSILGGSEFSYFPQRSRSLEWACCICKLTPARKSHCKLGGCPAHSGNGHLSHPIQRGCYRIGNSEARPVPPFKECLIGCREGKKTRWSEWPLRAEVKCRVVSFEEICRGQAGVRPSGSPQAFSGTPGRPIGSRFLQTRESWHLIALPWLRRPP